jgi:hypothetical protein
LTNTERIEYLDDPMRRALAAECRRDPGTAYDLSRRLGKSEGHVERTVKKMRGDGALLAKHTPARRGVVWALNPRWEPHFVIAQRKASVGRLRGGLRLIVVPGAGLRRTWELIANTSLVESVAWLSEIDAGDPGLLLAVDESEEPDLGIRMMLHLQGAQVDCHSLLVHGARDRDELRTRADALLKGVIENPGLELGPSPGAEDGA